MSKGISVAAGAGAGGALGSIFSSIAAALFASKHAPSATKAFSQGSRKLTRISSPRLGNPRPVVSSIYLASVDSLRKNISNQIADQDLMRCNVPMWRMDELI